MAATFSISNLPKFVKCSSTAYGGLLSKDASTLYYLTDQNTFWLGDHHYTQVEAVSAKPAAGSAVPGVLYCNTANGEIYLKDGNTVAVLGASSTILAGKMNKATAPSGVTAAAGQLLVAGDYSDAAVYSGVTLQTSGTLADSAASVPAGSVVKAYVDGEISDAKFYADGLLASLGQWLTLKGTKATEDALPTSGNKVGDLWIVTADNSEWVCTDATGDGTWEKLGTTTTVDLSGYLEKSGSFTSGNLVETNASGKAVDAGTSVTALQTGIDGKLAKIGSLTSANNNELVMVDSAGAAVKASGIKVKSSGDVASTDTASVPTGELVHSAISDGLGLLAWTTLS